MLQQSILTSSTSSLGPNLGPSTHRQAVPLQTVHDHLTGLLLSSRKQWTLCCNADTNAGVDANVEVTSADGMDIIIDSTISKYS